MPSPLDRLRAVLTAPIERRNARALARRLGVAPDDATWVYRRSREVGFGAAMLEYEERCRERARG